MRDIYIKTIPHDAQRYPTPGDYWRNADGAEEFRVSDIDNNDQEFLVAIHELVEWYLTEKRGVKEEEIKAFDEMFEEEKQSGLHISDEEPGFDQRAPYMKEHIFATKIEKMMAEELGVDWKLYGDAITKL
jgi:hypothetical protein